MQSSFQEYWEALNVWEFVQNVIAWFLGLLLTWLLIFGRKLKQTQRFTKGDSDDIIFQMHKLERCGDDGEVVLLFRTVGLRSTIHQMYDNLAARELVIKLSRQTTINNPILQTEKKDGFEVQNDAFNFIAGHLSTTHFDRQEWLFVMTSENPVVVRKNCIRCFLILSEDLKRFLDWEWCRTKVCVERESHWFRVVSLHQIAIAWDIEQKREREKEQQRANEEKREKPPVVDPQEGHTRFPPMSIGLNPNEASVSKVPIDWSLRLDQLKEEGMVPVEDLRRCLEQEASG